MHDTSDIFIKCLKMPQVGDEGQACSMEELIRAANDGTPRSDMQRAYRESYAMPLAMQALQAQMKALVAAGNTDYLPHNRPGHAELMGVAYHRSPELELDWNREKRDAGFIEQPGAYPKLRFTQSRIEDSLAMARKHVVDLMLPAVPPHADAVEREANLHLRRHAGCYVTNLMIAMAQDAAHAQARTAGVGVA